MAKEDSYGAKILVLAFFCSELLLCRKRESGGVTARVRVRVRARVRVKVRVRVRVRMRVRGFTPTNAGAHKKYGTKGP